MLWLAISDGHLRACFGCPGFCRYITVCSTVIHGCMLLNRYSGIASGNCELQSNADRFSDTVTMPEPPTFSQTARATGRSSKDLGLKENFERQPFNSGHLCSQSPPFFSLGLPPTTLESASRGTVARGTQQRELEQRKRILGMPLT